MSLWRGDFVSSRDRGSSRVCFCKSPSRLPRVGSGGSALTSACRMLTTRRLFGGVVHQQIAPATTD